MAMTIVEYKQHLLDKLQANRDADAEEHEQVTTAITTLKQQVVDALNGQVPQDVIDAVDASFDETLAQTQDIFTPDAPA